jgi:hypothetical protein
VLRLQGFLRRNGHPHQLLSPETDTHARVLIERFHIDPGELPIVLCPGGQLLRNPGEDELARCLGLVRISERRDWRRPGACTITSGSMHGGDSRLTTL